MNTLENPLYHYTNNYAFIEIIEKNKIWATNILYLNDSTEFQYVFEIVKAIMPKYIHLNTGISAKSLIVEKISSSLGNVGNIKGKVENFVCSFSEEKDQLSQWRGYCQDGNGINIGFDPNYLSDLSKATGSRLVKCIYNLDEQLDIVEKIVEKHLIYVDENEIDWTVSDAINSITLTFYKDILEFAPILKHPSFHEEKEWRLVIDPLKAKSLGVKYRNGKSMIVPYVEVDLSESNKPPINDITIGPCPHKDLSRLSVKHFLEARKIAFEQINNSEVPYRGW